MCCVAKCKCVTQKRNSMKIKFNQFSKKILATLANIWPGVCLLYPRPLLKGKSEKALPKKPLHLHILYSKTSSAPQHFFSFRASTYPPPSRKNNRAYPRACSASFLQVSRRTGTLKTKSGCLCQNFDSTGRRGDNCFIHSFHILSAGTLRPLFQYF